MVLITGSARRIGAAIAHRLHAAGYTLALHYRHSADTMQALVDELEAARTGSTLMLQADLEDESAPKALIEAVLARFGRLDGLINNASAFFDTPLSSATVAQWHTLLATNAQAPFFLAQQAAPALRDSGGAIVNLADYYAEHPQPDGIIHAASKAALIAVTRGLATALAPDVRVNAIAPGAICWPEEGKSQTAQQALLARVPMGRTGTPDDIAETVQFLLEGAGYMTGQVLYVDGGRSATG
ncbi:pteridine reductase [Oleiagrimonas sp. C23AA]|nr:pteridine reductase [Oleiagrimonas sp. C23AA]